MNDVKFSGASGVQKVVFENVIDVFAGGVHIDPDSATKYATSDPKVIPAGTLIGRKEVGGLHEIVTFDVDGELEATPLGLTHFDVMLDDMPLAAVVLSGTVRVEALPDDEQENWEKIAAKLPRITFVGESTIV